MTMSSFLFHSQIRNQYLLFYCFNKWFTVSSCSRISDVLQFSSTLPKKTMLMKIETNIIFWSTHIFFQCYHILPVTSINLFSQSIIVIPSWLGCFRIGKCKYVMMQSLGLLQNMNQTMKENVHPCISHSSKTHSSLQGNCLVVFTHCSGTISF